MHTIVFEDHEQLARDIPGLTPLTWSHHHFPDQESRIRIVAPVPKQVAILCGLNDANAKIFPLIMIAQTLRRLGAEHITLISPYFCYMRQDKEFEKGDAITNHIFGHLISQYVDHVVTVDPHLHRIKSMDEILSIPSITLHANSLLANYIKLNVVNPLIVGPDDESVQWVECIAKEINAPYTVALKVRSGDKDVCVTIEDLSPYASCHIVIVDDVVSSGQTIYQAAKAIEHPNITVLAVHAVFADNSYNLLRSVTPRIVTTNTIKHPSNGISITPMLRDVIADKRIQP